MLRNKAKFILSLAALVSTVGVLASCDSIKAKPTASDYNAELLSFSDGSNVTYNTLSRIYDALVTDNDTNSEKVLNNVLYIYSQSIFGSFFDTTSNGIAQRGLKSVCDTYISGGETNNTEIQKFADTYSGYSGHIYNVLNFYNDVLYRINAVFLGYVQNSTYQKNSQFSEEEFYKAQIKNFYKLATTASDGTLPYKTGHTQVEGSLRLNEEAATDTVLSKYFKDIFHTYSSYIEINVLPDIYRTELTDQYLYTQNFGQIRLTSGRKVDYVALAENGQYGSAVQNLMKAYCHEVIEGKYDSSVNVDNYGFTFLDDLYKGTNDLYNNPANALDSSYQLAKKIYKDAGWTSDHIVIGSTTYYYYLQSGLGTIVTGYQKLSSTTSDSTNYNDFTNSGAYSRDTGFKIKLQALEATDNTTNGWFTTGGLSKLPSSLSDRIFKVQVANEVDSEESSTEKDDYGWYIDSHYYLTPSTYETDNNYPYLVSNSSTYYIVRVDEATKAAKITVPSDSATADEKKVYYDTTRAPGTAEKISRQVGYSISSSDTWKKAAEAYFVDQMKVAYHDTYVYNYFKKTFPDLFD